jgi:hypothetical protein
MGNSPLHRTPVGYGPFDGEYYDECEEVEDRGLLVLWAGKVPERSYQNLDGLTKITFTDDSFVELADPGSLRVYNSGSGNLAIISRDGVVLAK